MIDILYLAKGREQFTSHSITRLVLSLWPHWDNVRLLFYSDGEAADRITSAPGGRLVVNTSHYGGPVPILNHYIAAHAHEAEFVAKIDNDVIVPDGWLRRALRVMHRCPELHILGLEPPASRTRNPESNQPVPRAPEEAFSADSGDYYARVSSVGGVFLARTSAFVGCHLPVPTAGGRGGFTSWQGQNKSLVCGWIVPPLKLFLLDRLPFEPWLSLSRRYEMAGEQRPWTKYDLKDKERLWTWWVDETEERGAAR